MKRRSLFALILFIQFASVSLAQQPNPSPAPNSPVRQQPTKPAQEDDDVVKITTNLVQVDAVVTDKNGRPVTDLRPEEVQITEDGKSQKIMHFSFILAASSESTAATTPTTREKTNVAPPPGPPVILKPEQVRRTIAIVVDDLGLSFQSIYYVRRALKKFVDEQMQPGDLVAIIRTSGGIGALQQFTSDKRQLYAAIDRVKWNANGRGGVSPFAPMDAPTPGDSGAQMDAANDDLNQFREDVFAVGTLGAVNYVVKGMRELPGRKSVLLVSDGFRIFSRDDPTKSYLALQKLQRLIDQAGRASVVIYTMNATGLQTLGLTAADNTGERSAQDIEDQLSSRRNAAFETQEGLDYLAKETGGLAIHNTNDLSGGIRRIMEDQKGYYLIGYRPDESTFDPRSGRRLFHRLGLKVLRPGKYNVRMRNGFYGVSDEESKPAPQTRDQQLIGAITSPFGSSDIHLQLTSIFGNNASGSMMESFLHIDARDLKFTDEPDGSHKGSFDILALTFGDNGSPLDQIGRTYSLPLSGDNYKSALRDGILFTVIVPIKKPGAYQLRVALRDAVSSRVGSASQFVEVPDLKRNRLALSGVMLNGLTVAEYARLSNPSPRPSGATGAGPPPAASGESVPAEVQRSAAPNAPPEKATIPAAANRTSPPAGHEAGAGQGNLQTSAAVRHLRMGMVVQYGFVIYNAQIDKASGQPQLTTQLRLFRDGKPVFTGKILPFEVRNQTDLKRLVAGGALQLGADMTPGEYVLQVIVTDLLAHEKYRTATQWMDFEIVK